MQEEAVLPLSLPPPPAPVGGHASPQSANTRPGHRPGHRPNSSISNSFFLFSAPPDRRRGSGAASPAAHGKPVLPHQQYELRERVGRGSFGVVRKAIHLPSQQVVAIKMIGLDGGRGACVHVHLLSDDDGPSRKPKLTPGHPLDCLDASRDRTHDGTWETDTSDDIADIVTEISTLADLSSPWVTKYYESFVLEATLWIVMEYCSGGSCLDLLQSHHQGLPEEAVGVIIVQVLQALSYLHGLGKIHRDIKAANILLTEEGRALLADFGVSAQISATITKKNTFVGTPFWMAPEVILRSRYNSKADIWSLGITAIELATRLPPHAQLHPMRVLFLIPQQAPPTLPAGATDCTGTPYTAEFRDFLASCLQVKPSERKSARELLQHPWIRRHAGVLGGPAAAPQTIGNVLAPVIRAARQAQLLATDQSTTTVTSATTSSGRSGPPSLPSHEGRGPTAESTSGMASGAGTSWDFSTMHPHALPVEEEWVAPERIPTGFEVLDEGLPPIHRPPVLSGLAPAHLPEGGGGLAGARTAPASNSTRTVSRDGRAIGRGIAFEDEFRSPPPLPGWRARSRSRAKRLDAGKRETGEPGIVKREKRVVMPPRAHSPCEGQPSVADLLLARWRRDVLHPALC